MFIILIFGGDSSEVFICQNLSSCELSTIIMSIIIHEYYGMMGKKGQDPAKIPHHHTSKAIDKV